MTSGNPLQDLDGLFTHFGEIVDPGCSPFAYSVAPESPKHIPTWRIVPTTFYVKVTNCALANRDFHSPHPIGRPKSRVWQIGFTESSAGATATRFEFPAVVMMAVGLRTAQ